MVHDKGFGICFEFCEKSLLKAFKQGNEMIISLGKMSGDSEENR